MEYLLLVIGFILLIKGADVFVDGASKIARKIGIPSIIVGLTIVSIGTSAPELAISIISALDGNGGIAIGNVIGSNMFNALVVLGATSVISPIIFKKTTVKRDYVVDLFATILVYILTFGFSMRDGDLSRMDGVILLFICIIYMILLIRIVRGRDLRNENRDENINIFKNIIVSIIGIIGIVIGGDMVVDNATVIATTLGMSEKLVGLTIVAMGTSLPELVTSIVAAIKGEKEIALGNVLGSNIFNLLLIIGTSSAISPFIVSKSLIVDFIILIISTILIGGMIFLNKKDIKKITRIEGVMLLAIYVCYLIYIITRN
ncbi:calcium/sodium antiporter [Clostridium sp. MSJ-8]|uniref:calcium/sodium antiporter n=1 Tax=Clostridium sp. MSJ-8 TaxID=2841510 RepID=UPI001C0ED280|nr:calcium/sodium antiporter [Clostridium sp. MSJ-8]MBU5487772.1 calcium/sodium antiporter [Clostridium sp. MSJ-8]